MTFKRIFNDESLIKEGKVPKYAEKIADYVEDAINLAGECSFNRTCVSIRPYDKLKIIINLTDHPEGVDITELKKDFICDYCTTYEIKSESCIENDKDLGSYIDEGAKGINCESGFCTEYDLAVCPEPCSKINYDHCCLDDCLSGDNTKCFLGFLLNKFIGHLCDNDCLINDDNTIKISYEKYKSKGENYLHTLRLKCIERLAKLSKISS